jgi:predicted RNA methylase
MPKPTRATGLHRDNNEAYFTKPEVATVCVQYVNTLFPLTNFDTVIEPSAGDGSFLKSLRNYDIKELLSFDIDPKEETIVKSDFLLLNFESTNKTLVIGNPPFGRQSSLAKKFIKHCCKFANVIAFILPKSFKKSSMTTCFSLDFHKIFERDLEPNSFIYDENEYSVPCVFQIWERRLYMRQTVEKVIENSSYKIVKKTDNPDIAFRRVGVYAGKFTYSEIEKLSCESHYFIRLNVPISENLRSKIDALEWESVDNTTGPRSISKQELMKELNKFL